jgi:hypothetical protein
MQRSFKNNVQINIQVEIVCLRFRGIPTKGSMLGYIKHTKRRLTPSAELSKKSKLDDVEKQIVKVSSRSQQLVVLAVKQELPASYPSKSSSSSLSDPVPALNTEPVLKPEPGLKTVPARPWQEQGLALLSNSPSLLLPAKYKLLIDMFWALETVLQLRRKQLVFSFAEIKNGVEGICAR